MSLQPKLWFKDARRSHPLLSLLPQLVLVSPTGEQYDSLLRHLRERIDEGCGETIYVVGMGSGKDG